MCYVDANRTWKAITRDIVIWILALDRSNCCFRPRLLPRTNIVQHRTDRSLFVDGDCAFKLVILSHLTSNLLYSAAHLLFYARTIMLAVLSQQTCKYHPNNELRGDTERVSNLFRSVVLTLSPNYARSRSIKIWLSRDPPFYNTRIIDIEPIQCDHIIIPNSRARPYNIQNNQNRYCKSRSLHRTYHPLPNERFAPWNYKTKYLRGKK